MRHFNWRYASVFAGIGILAFAGDAQAGRFQLNETNASNMGDATAGSAAKKNDIATQFNNPATMTTVNKNGAKASLTAVVPNLKYDVTSATYVDGTSIRNGNDGDNGTPAALVPAAYLMWAVNDSLRLGLGVTSPFGLQTDYNKNWSGRLFGTRSKLETVDVNPSFALKLHEKLSVGAGFSVQYVKADIASGLQELDSGLQTPELSVKGKGVGYGFNLGLLFTPWSHTRFGLAYRSAIRHKLKGHMDVSFRDNAQFGTLGGYGTFTGVALTGFSSLPTLAPNGTSVRAPLTLPETATFSVQHDFNDKWTAGFDARWTRWTQFQSLSVDVDWNPNYAGNVLFGADPAIAALANNLQGFAVTNITESLKARNTWFFGLGTSYKYSDQTTLKFGIAHDRNAQKDSSVRLPDNDRIWFSGGLDHDFTENLTMNLGYSFVKVSNTDVSQQRSYAAAGVGMARAAAGVAQAVAGGLAPAGTSITPSAFGTQSFNARAKSYVNIFGVSVQYKF